MATPCSAPPSIPSHSKRRRSISTGRSAASGREPMTRRPRGGRCLLVGPRSLADSLRDPLVGIRPPHELHLSDPVAARTVRPAPPRGSPRSTGTLLGRHRPPRALPRGAASIGKLLLHSIF